MPVRTLRQPTEPIPSAPGLRAVSFSRDSDGKHQRLEEWAARKGLSLHEREHRRNRWTASKQGFEVAAEVSSIECAADGGKRGAEVIATARDARAVAVIIPSLRRLGVGPAQMQLRRLIEEAGLRIVSERETENAILRSESSPSRDLLLDQIAATDQYEWEVNKERLRRAHVNFHETPEWRATLAFVAARPHLTLQRLAEFLEARGYQTLTGRKNWTRQQVLRARREVARNQAALLREAR